MRVLVTRPAGDAKSLLATLKSQGHVGVLAPLLDIRILAGVELDLAGVQALVLTSANGARAFAARSGVRDVPALCVGDATAREALALGFETVKSAAGDVEALAALVIKTLDPNQGTLLHPASTRVAGDLAGLLDAEGFVYRREVLYEAVKADVLPEIVRTEVLEGTLDGVLLFSPRTGAAFADLVDRAGLATHLKGISAFCLSDPVAQNVGALKWKHIRVAAKPDQASLLALLNM
jgi:uroporphyrinogen-III synthase